MLSTIRIRPSLNQANSEKTNVADEALNTLWTPVDSLILLPQVAVQFADLHDTPARMTEKGVIRGVIPWEDARTVLYWRLRRRILESQLVRELNLFRFY